MRSGTKKADEISTTRRPRAVEHSAVGTRLGIGRVRDTPDIKGELELVRLGPLGLV